MQHNRRIHKKYLEELSFLKDLPERKTIDFTEERARVTTSSTIRMRDIVYSVPSRLIGMTLKIHLYDDRLECFVGGDLVETLDRKRRNHKRVHQVNYRHVIGALQKKPQAFRNYIYREELFPTLAFRETWERLNKKLDSRIACREYIKILKEAAEGDHEEIVNSFLEKQLCSNILPSSIEVQNLFKKEKKDPALSPIEQSLEGYDALVGGGI